MALTEEINDSIDSTMATIYAVFNEERIPIQSVEYTIKRHREPIYSLGSSIPMSMVMGQRTIMGTLYLKDESFNKLSDKTFDIHIETKEESQVILIKDVSFYQDRYIYGESRYIAEFIARNVDVNVIEKLGEMTNRQLAKRLLTKEY
jgi:hypothetical protein